MRNEKSKPPTRGRGRPQKLPARALAAQHGNGANHQPIDPLEGKLVVRPDEAWKLLSIGKSLGFRLVADGTLKTTRIGHATLIHVASIRELLGISPPTT